MLMVHFSLLLFQYYFGVLYSSFFLQDLFAFVTMFQLFSWPYSPLGVHVAISQTMKNLASRQYPFVSIMASKWRLTSASPRKNKHAAEGEAGEAILPSEQTSPKP